MVQMPQPGDTFGRYRIIDRIGRGGMGVVFSALQIDLGREVALKLLAPELADSLDSRQRFLREAATLARLDSPHVVTVHDAGQQDGWVYIATQLVPDGDLSQRLATAGPLVPLGALDVVAQVAAGLADAHRAGVIHRDLKPSNVLLRNRSDGGITAIICDLGIARTQDSEHTLTVGVFGTAGYLAPERHSGEQATVASDIYSLGCLLWAALSGRAPYEGTDFTVAMAHQQDPVPQLPPHLPGAPTINPVLLRAMAKDPAQRFASAREMRNALLGAAQALAGTSAATQVLPGLGASPVAAPAAPAGQPAPAPAPGPTPTQLYPPVPVPARTRRKAPWIALALVLLLAGGGVGGYLLWQKAQDDEVRPVADAISELSGTKLSYNLGESSALCAARKVVDAADRDDSTVLAAELREDWQELSEEQAVMVANGVVNCSAAVYDRLVADVLADETVSDADCARERLTETEVANLLVTELRGNGDDVQGQLDDLLADCG